MLEESDMKTHIVYVFNLMSTMKICIDCGVMFSKLLILISETFVKSDLA